ncbi:early endosome antigen 1-like [Actinia tenebrosa]|uniref:Early endosome antigen 1-like n=1 Tax=Actinia tenebrosa TaxID=6105 RepID=A0A6P8H1K8_ACTTE|nr:early endosome antigen 1-like [Actinia tenebrosa]
MEETDFDPLTEEGQVDINDEEPLLPDQPIDDSVRSRIRNAFARSRERNHAGLREHIELRNMETIEWAKQELTRRYPRFEADEVKLTKRKDKVLISVQDLRFPDKDRWTKPQLLFDENGDVRGDVARLRGFQQATRSMLERLETLNEKVALERRVEELQETLEEREAEYVRQTRLLSNAERQFSQQDARMEEMAKQLDDTKRELENARKSHTPTAVLEKTLRERESNYQRQLSQLSQSKDEDILTNRREAEKALNERDTARRAFNLALEDLNMSKEEVKNLEATIEGSLVERRQLIAEIKIKEEQIQQRTTAIEDLERNISEKQEIINDQSRPEEEREAAQAEKERLQEEVAKLQAQKDKMERELGLTTKEKVKRALMKYGVPLAFAIAISTAVGVIMSALKAAGSGVNKLGKGLTNMGKKMAASLPGLLGSVVGLALRAGGELLKFVGNNIWILVVAIGVVLLKKVKG